MFSLSILSRRERGGCPLSPRCGARPILTSSSSTNASTGHPGRNPLRFFVLVSTILIASASAVAVAVADAPAPTQRTSLCEEQIPSLARIGPPSQAHTRQSSIALWPLRSSTLPGTDSLLETFFSMVGRPRGERSPCMLPTRAVANRHCIFKAGPRLLQRLPHHTTARSVRSLLSAPAGQLYVYTYMCACVCSFSARRSSLPCRMFPLVFVLASERPINGKIPLPHKCFCKNNVARFVV